jgi:hypothetical protein
VLIVGGGPQSFEFGPISDTIETTHLEAAETTPALPTLTPVAAIQAEPVITPVSPVYEGLATHYGVSYNGSRMGCVGDPYSSENETIVAVGYMHNSEWPCGTPLRVCGVAGCIVGFRQDTCPGCGSYHIDLSEAGINKACGDQAHVCRVGIEQVLFEMPPPEMPPPIEVLLPVDPVIESIIPINLEAPAAPNPILIDLGLEPVP